MNAVSPVTLDAMVARIAAARATASALDPAAGAWAEAVDALNAEAFRRLLRLLRPVPGAAQALREAAADEVVYAVLRGHGLLKPSLHERVEAALDAVRPTLAAHGGDVELVAVERPVVRVRLLGACDGCPASSLTLYAGVRTAIQDAVPEITDVQQVRGQGGGISAPHVTSPFAAEAWLPAGTMAELLDGQTRILDIAEHQVLLSRFGDEVRCFENACAHLGLRMDRAGIEAGRITCPHHGFVYALDSGECLTAPEVQLQPHAVRVVGGRIELRLT